MLFDSNGNLKAGIIDYTPEEFVANFIDGFPTSQTRFEISRVFFSAFEYLFSFCNPSEIWIDGSYATHKMNPNDIDMVVFFDYDVIDLHQSKIEGIKGLPNIDFYYYYSISDLNKRHFSDADFHEIVNHRNYWRGQFGFDREDQPKGIIRLNPILLKIFLEGRV